MYALNRTRAHLSALLIALGTIAGTPAAIAQSDARFAAFIQSLWPEAQKLGIARATFERETQSLSPDLGLPDLVNPGRPEKQRGEQAEFVQVPSDYLKETSLANLAAQGRALAAKHKDTLAAIEQRFGVPGSIVLAIWGRETNFGAAKLPHSALRALATQAYLGRRKDQFREEFLLALKMIQEGHITSAAMKSSWAGALGHPQILPSGFYKYAVDFDGDGKRDVWNSVPDALATIANHIRELGWQRGQRWSYEVKVPANVDCTIAQPEHSFAIGQWVQRGYAPLGRQPSAADLKAPASLLMPEGTYGPAFLTTKNYYALKDYNFSDLYVLFVGNVADRIAGGGAFVTPWAKTTQVRAADVEAMQTIMTTRGIYKDKVDGRAGMLTRSALGAYQKSNSLKLDCWPSTDVLRHMQSSR
ncbi:membrane-bound lytic murein transglycosylase B precursor [Variibacter gotjawalensis]|uniref:Membrane-bound lytic murein transglycosylase B n=1 Tax=Variibacter gotjawalensis TaxID=1333996 RepID=A0A0S3PTQ5_9BRAD|nr:lytic murein transglycosylase [Variibacter gotjawalensis]NIK49583.1 lytic murein transglycosylase [Variibacter gotjawalensis]RZS45594.1 lytic murein transglycosylase [Variibacter gotjawalensis]BAT59267.1 membrane-bound lytic murein transglycosylase B precursor [Variibacter gotjawalensis]